MTGDKEGNKNSGWALSAREYLDRTDRTTVASPKTNPAGSLLPRTTGRVTWDESLVDFELIKTSTVERSLYRLKRSLPVLIWNAAALEGNTFTLPQVQTLLDGVSVGGKRLEETEQILALSSAMEKMIELVSAGSFKLDKSTSDQIHALVAQHEAIESGHFRGEGSATGGGNVRLAEGGTIAGDPAGKSLVSDFSNLLADLAALKDPRARALLYFASAVRSQFYFDGNKRTARIMMTGALITAGFEPINIPFARQEEFNVALDQLFKTDSATELVDFLTTCTILDGESS